MPMETVPGTGLSYYLIAYDAEGRERRDDPEGLMSARAIEAVGDPGITDVFLLSHGWRGDLPAARAQYGRWIAAMAGCPADIERMKQVRRGFRPLLIGLHWPSEPWGDDSFGEAASFGADGDENDPIAGLVDELAARTADTPTTREALRTLVALALDDNNPSRLPDEAKAAYEALNRELGLGERGEAAAPGDDREPFDAEALYQEGQESAVSFGGFADGLLSPLRTLSFWTMKDRARRFGETGAHRLLAELSREGAPRGVRFHLMGHSFGCIAVSGAVSGPVGASLPAPVDSLALVQGALSLWSYCEEIPSKPGTPGYFRRMIAERRVRGPIITTQSEYDRAVGTWYPWAAGVRGQVSFGPGDLPRYGAVGSFGIRGPGAEGEDRAILPSDQTYGFEPGKIYNIDGSAIINLGGGFAGAHGDFAKPEVAHAVWEAAMT